MPRLIIILALAGIPFYADKLNLLVYKDDAGKQQAVKTPADGEAKGESAPAADDDEKLPPLPAGTEPSGPPPQRFNPTEKVRADFPVSFPIDI